MASTPVSLSILLNVLIVIIAAAPNCTYNGSRNTDLVCAPTDDASYVLKRGLVSDSNKTTSVILRGCRITEIKKQAFQNLFYLDSIDLSENSIAELKLGVLDGTRNVKNLNLSSNLIENLPLGVFDQKPDLLTLDLSSNRLIDLKLGIFDALKKLKHLDLSNNSLQAKLMSPYIFDRSRYIKYMDFSNNNMDECPENFLHALIALETLNLNECFLSEFPLFATRSNMRTLKNLSLAKNQITIFQNTTIFVNLENLERLDLTKNYIEEIQEEIFAPLKKLTALSLRNNKLTHIPEKLFQNQKQLMNLDLSFNKITMVPVNAFRGTVVKNLNLSNNRFTFLIANFCLELRNSGVRLAKFFFNQNPWQCACLQEVLREVKQLDIDYNSSAYDGKRPVCVTTEEYTCKRHEKFNNIYIELYDNIGKTK